MTADHILLLRECAVLAPYAPRARAGTALPGQIRSKRHDPPDHTPDHPGHEWLFRRRASLLSAAAHQLCHRAQLPRGQPAGFGPNAGHPERLCLKTQGASGKTPRRCETENRHKDGSAQTARKSSGPQASNKARRAKASRKGRNHQVASKGNGSEARCQSSKPHTSHEGGCAQTIGQGDPQASGQAQGCAIASRHGQDRADPARQDTGNKAILESGTRHTGKSTRA